MLEFQSSLAKCPFNHAPFLYKKKNSSGVPFETCHIYDSDLHANATGGYSESLYNIIAGIESRVCVH